MGNIVFEVFLCVLLVTVITARENNSSNSPLIGNVSNMFKRSRNLPQLLEVSDVNSTEIVQPDVCKCKNGKCITNEKGRQICQCSPGFGLYKSKECKECNCGEGSNCTFSLDWLLVMKKTCICKEGYEDKKGICVASPTTPEPTTETTVNVPKTRKPTLTTKETSPTTPEPTTETTVNVPKTRKPTLTTKENSPTMPEITTNTTENVPKTTKATLTTNENLCIPNPCQNGGICKMAYDDYNCTCKFPYSGRNCEKDCECENGICVEDLYGNPICQCPPGFGLYLNKICKACECGGGSSCEFNESGAATVKTCLCKEPYKKVMDICKECYCGPSSSCFFENYDIKRCICPDGHMEINGVCKDPCNPNPCRNRGKCQFFKGNYSCACFPPYSGRTCEINCSCGPNGKCSLDIYGKKQCYCRHGFAEFEGLCKECSCGSYSACFFNKDGDKRCACESGYTYINGKCEDKKENIVLPALLGAILVSILFGILIFTCVLWKKK